MTIRINNIVLGLDDDIEVVKKRVSKKLKVSIGEIENFKIIKESLDARNKNNIKFTYAVEVNHKNEKKIVGFYVTGHPLDSYSAALENYTQIYKLTEASEEMDGKYYSIAGLISGVRLRTTKSGDTMAVLTLEDFSGRIEVVVFTRQYHEFSSLLYQENVV